MKNANVRIYEGTLFLLAIDSSTFVVNYNWKLHSSLYFARVKYDGVGRQFLCVIYTPLQKLFLKRIIETFALYEYWKVSCNIFLWDCTG